MKRFLAVMALLLFAMLAFARGSEEAEEESAAAGGRDLGGRIIRVAAWWDPAPDLNADWGIRLQAKIEYMEEQYNFHIEWLNPGGWDAYYSDLIASTLAGDPMAEMVYVDQAWLASMVAQDLLQPVDGYDEVNLSDPWWHPLKMVGFTWSGHAYGIKDTYIEPYTVMFFNKDMLEREGLGTVYDLQESGQWTWDEMLEMARAVTRDLDGDGETDQWGFANDNLAVLPLSLIYGNGGSVVAGVEEGEPYMALDSPEALEAIQYYQDLVVQEKVVMMQPDGAAWNWYMSEFAAGNILFLPGYFWYTDQFGEVQDEYGCALFPTGPSGDENLVYYAPNNSVCVPAGVEDLDDVLFAWNAIWAENPEFDDPDADPYDWLYGKVMDTEAVDLTLHRMYENNQFVIAIWGMLGLKDIVEQQVFPPIASGETSPAAQIEEMTPVLQAAIDNALGN
jgi:multiple sugar transport system substrate-binding protein